MTAESVSCYCEERDCKCTPEIAAAVERLLDPRPAILIPLTYGAALDLAEAAIGEGTALGYLPVGRVVLIRHRVAQALQAVDVAAREQADDPVHDEATCSLCIAIASHAEHLK